MITMMMIMAGNPIKFSSLNIVFKALHNVASTKLVSSTHCLSTYMVYPSPAKLFKVPKWASSFVPLFVSELLFSSSFT